jgi:hypothetical protein
MKALKTKGRDWATPLFPVLALSVLLVACVSGPGPSGDGSSSKPQAQASTARGTDTLAVEVTVPAVEARVEFDPSTTIAPINRGLFSYVNYQDLADRGSPLAIKAMQDLYLHGGHQRLATNPPGFEPENDNDDPLVTDWERLHPEALFPTELLRGVELVDRVIEDGMEPMLLLAYNLPWLSPDGGITRAPTDPHEWAEFAVAAIQSINGTDPTVAPKLKLVEIWNEPDTELYWKGSKEQFYELFNIVAERIHRECPGVIVGGPAALNYTSPWALGFIDACGQSMDAYIYHSYNEVPELLVERLGKMADYLLRKTGREIPIIISEVDSFDFTGDLKFDYLMRRQAALQGPEARTLIGFHHFQARAYKEGERFFGLVTLEGNLIDYNYWPYWMYRHYRGDRTVAKVSSGDPLVNRQLIALGARSGDTVLGLVHLPVQARKRTRTTLSMPVPEDFKDAMLLVYGAGAGTEPGIVLAEKIAGREVLELVVDLAPGQAHAMVLVKDGVEDLVWTRVRLDHDEVLVGDSLTVEAEVFNQSSTAVDGRISLAGFPTDWIVSAEGPDSLALEPGEKAVVRFKVETRSVTPIDGSPLFAFAQVRRTGGRLARIPSVPASVKALSPVDMVLKPYRVFAAPGESVKVELQVRNSYSSAVSGDFSLDLPEGFVPGKTQRKTVAFASTDKVPLSFTVPRNAKPGEYPASVAFDFNGVRFSAAFDLVIAEYSSGQRSVAVKLGNLFNADGITSRTDFGDFKDFGGRFTIPAEFLPPAGPVSYLGIEFDFPSYGTGVLNMVQTKGQVVPVARGNYTGLAVLATATNSNKRESLVVNYDDGSFADLSLAVSDWCVAPRFGEIPVVKAPYRHIPEGVLMDAQPQIFLLRYPLDPKKRVVSITLPERNELYVLAMSLVR